MSGNGKVGVFFAVSEVCLYATLATVLCRTVRFDFVQAIRKQIHTGVASAKVDGPKIVNGYLPVAMGTQRVLHGYSIGTDDLLVERPLSWKFYGKGYECCAILPKSDRRQYNNSRQYNNIRR